MLLPKLGPDHPYSFSCRNALARAYLSGGRAAEAITIWEAMVPAARKSLGPAHPNTLGITHALYQAYELRGRWADTEPLRRELISDRRKAVAVDSPLLAGDLAALGQNLIAQQKFAEAERILRESLKIRETKFPDDWSTFDTRSLLGASLLGQGKFRRRRRLIVGGYEGIKLRESKIPTPRKASLKEAIERAVRLYDAWGDPAKGVKWRQKSELATDLPAALFAR